MIYAVFHSRDLDGWTSGAIIKKRYPDATLIGYDYGQEFPWHLVPEGADVIMADVSLPMGDMFKLAEHAGSFTWIDHHISAINDYKDAAPFFDSPKMKITAVLDDRFSACEGTWKHLFMGEDIPGAVWLLGEYDTWRNGDKTRWENLVLPFQFGMRMICNSPETFQMDLLTTKEEIQTKIAETMVKKTEMVRSQKYVEAANLRDQENNLKAKITDLKDDLQKIMEDGKTVLTYQREQYKTMCRRSFTGKFDGLRVVCLNGVGSSDAFAAVWDEEQHDAMLAFTYTGKLWTVSLYTTKNEVDCSAIAKAHGGGGHKKAAGFQVDNIEELISTIKNGI